MSKQRYQNLDHNTPDRGLADVLAWKLGRPSAAALAAVSRENDPGYIVPYRQGLTSAERLTLDQPAPMVQSDLAALHQASRPGLTWIGHATFLVQLGGASILTDPILSPRIALLKRLRPPGIDFAALPPIQVVTVSHNHRDHMDEPTLRRLGPAATYIVPQGLGAWFRQAGLAKVIELDWWQEATVAGVRFTLVPSHHWSRRGLSDTNQTLWGGFVMSGGGRTVYHSGDTAYFSGFRDIGERCGPIDAAMLPIGAYEPRWFMRPQHMNPVDAVRAFADLGAQRFVAMHWGTFVLTDEPVGEPPAILRAVWQKQGLASDRLAVPAIGETVWL
jgi:L-ascorbate metabolism protein UlaG (beta-lactamase superfamily)